MLFAVALTVALAVPLLVFSNMNASTYPSTSRFGLPTLAIWQVGEAGTLSQAAQNVNYSVISPSHLPSGAMLNSVRYSSALNLVLLEYTVPGAASIGNNSELMILEQSSSSNPLPLPTAVIPPVVATTRYANGTVASRTLYTASTTTSPWSSLTLGGQSVLTLTPTGGSAQIQWWYGGVWYRLYSSIPMAELEEVASSIISSPNIASG